MNLSLRFKSQFVHILSELSTIKTCNKINVITIRNQESKKCHVARVYRAQI